MKTPDRYRLRRPYLLETDWPGAVLVIFAFPMGSLFAFYVGGHFIGVPVTLIAMFSALVALVAWPVRTLDITRGALRFRERSLPPGVRHGWRRRTTRLRTLGWHEVVEVLLAADRGQDCLVVGFRDPRGGLGAAVVGLPEGGAPAVAEVIRRVAPGVVVREDRLADIFIRTREPYVLRGWKPRTRLLVRALNAFGGVGAFVALTLASGSLHSFRLMPLSLCLLSVETWFEARQMVLTPEGVWVGPWWGRHALWWAAVREVRLAATGDGAELTVVTGEGTETRRLPEVSGLGTLDAIIRAWAPPNALTRPVQGQVGDAP